MLSSKTRERQRCCAALLGGGRAAPRPAAPQPVPPAFQEQAVEETEYRIAPADVLAIRVWKNPELSVEAAPVLPDGSSRSRSPERCPPRA